MRCAFRLVFILALAFAMFPVAAAEPTGAQKLFAEAVRAVGSNDTEKAKALLVEALAVDPRHRQSALLLQRIRMQEQAGGGLEERLSQIIIPELDVREASLGSVLDHLPRLATQHSKDQFTLNLVRVFTPEYANETRITLSLRQVPLTEVLRYVAQAGGLEMQYQPHAVVLSRPQGSSGE